MPAPRKTSKCEHVWRCAARPSGASNEYAIVACSAALRSCINYDWMLRWKERRYWRRRVVAVWHWLIGFHFRLRKYLPFALAFLNSNEMLITHEPGVFNCSQRNVRIEESWQITSSSWAELIYRMRFRARNRRWWIINNMKQHFSTSWLISNWWVMKFNLTVQELLIESNGNVLPFDIITSKWNTSPSARSAQWLSSCIAEQQGEQMCHSEILHRNVSLFDRCGSKPPILFDLSIAPSLIGLLLDMAHLDWCWCSLSFLYHILGIWQ